MEHQNDKECETISTRHDRFDSKDQSQDYCCEDCKDNLGQKVAEAIGTSFHAHDP